MAGIPGRCKICGLPANLRWKIEEAMKGGKGPTIICNEFPEANLNEGNIYSHRRHLTKLEAQDIYEEQCRSKAKDVGSRLKVGDEVPKLAKKEEDKPTTLPKPIVDLIEKKTTGNWVLDDVQVLDAIIEQAKSPEFMNQIRPDHVLQAIRLKKELLGDDEKTNDGTQMKIQMGVILQMISDEKPPKIVVDVDPEDEYGDEEDEED